MAEPTKLPVKNERTSTSTTALRPFEIFAEKSIAWSRTLPGHLARTPESLIVRY